ncbi:hypothetical protein MIR68_007082 [Amoeboaphelidium protococcarum]|nr:hypothetical protein MIR68_007082 [Amoeboaphelidium protococcarum]
MQFDNTIKNEYLPIDQYGVIGNLRTCALVGMDGSIDFLCYPKFDSSSIFCKILDKDKGGHFSVKPIHGAQWSPFDMHGTPATECMQQTDKKRADYFDTNQDGISDEPKDNDLKYQSTSFSSKQQYFPQTNMLLTRFLSENAVGQVTDYMPLPYYQSQGKSSSGAVVLPWIARHVDVVRGRIRFRIECFPAFEYGTKSHKTSINAPVTCDGNGDGFRAPHADSCNISNYNELADQWTPFREGTMQNNIVLFESEDGEQVFELCALVKYSDDEDYDPEVDGKFYETALCPLLTWKKVKRDGMLGEGVVGEITLFERQELILVFREHPQLSKRAVETHQICLKSAVNNPVKSKSDQQTRSIDPLLFDPPLTVGLLNQLRHMTHEYWLGWSEKCKYTGRWRETVLRSALTLKLLTYAPTGAVVASPTFGLPESVGGVRNWDYRFSWVRDSAFTIYAFLRIGFTEEAKDYWDFMQKRCNDLNPDGSLSIMYTIDGKKYMPESQLDHLEGYRQSKPVRIGNAAQDHLQLDIYGELMDAAYLYNKFGSPISYDLWCSLRRLVDYVCDNWDRPDNSIWEVRGEMKHFTYSKVMCWVAVDRGLRLSEKRMLPCPDRQRWFQTRDKIYEDIMEKCFDKQKKTFTQCYENNLLDCACLIMPLVFFISPSDPRFTSTLREICKSPERGGLLINNFALRYDPIKSMDGLPGQEGTFTMTTFWLVEALTRAGKYHTPFLRKAHFIFEQLLSYGNHLGLFSEEIAKSGELLGNMPQAFSHIALISAAYNLDRTLSGKGTNSN